MKRNAIIAIVIGVIILSAAAFMALNMLAPANAPAVTDTNVTPVPSPVPVKEPVNTSALEQFGLLGEKVKASGKSFAGAALQLVNGEETAMVYLYKPQQGGDVSDLLATGFSSAYEVFDTKEMLLVGIVDTTQYIASQQFKVDIYALERAVVAEYARGNMTATELAGRALIVTPETESLRPGGNNSTVKKSIDLTSGKNRTFSDPGSRTLFFVESLNQSGYLRPISLQAGEVEGQKMVSVVMALKRNATTADNYKEMEAALRACAGSYGDHDRYMITLIPPAEGFNDYYMIDANSGPVLDYFDGLSSQYKLYNSINLTYYTK